MKLHFDWRDLFKAPRMAISTGKRLVIQTLGLLTGYVGYLILTYLALMVSGQSLGDSWRAFGFFPVYFFDFGDWLGTILWVAGILFFLACWMLFSTAVAKVTYEELKGDQFYSTKESLRFMRGRVSSVLFSPLTLLAVLIFVALCGMLLGLIGRIPALGELIIGLFYGIPIFVVAVFTTFVAFVFILCFVLTPPIVGCLKSDTFTTVLHYFQTVWNQPGRFFGYSFITLALAKVGVFIFGYFVMRGLQLANWACGIGMGDKLGNIYQAALGYLPPPQYMDFFTTLYPGSTISYQLTDLAGNPGLSFTGSLAAFLIGLTLVIIFFLMVAYGLATFTCGQTISFIITYKHREDENLLERPSEEEEPKEKEIEGKVKEKREPAGRKK